MLWGDGVKFRTVTGKVASTKKKVGFHVQITSDVWSSVQRGQHFLQKPLSKFALEFEIEIITSPEGTLPVPTRLGTCQKHMIYGAAIARK
jgi:hypothetical protein